jgi:PmbA protein
VIARLLDALTGRVSAADVVVKVDDTLSLAIGPDGDTRVGGSRSRTSQLRVVREGRVGYAWSSGDDAGELVGRAMSSAVSGGELELLLPAPAPFPETITRTPRAAVADPEALDRLARLLLERLRRSDRRIEVWAERSAGSVEVGNTRGVLAGYECSLAGVGVVVESIGAGWAPPCRLHTAAAGLPALGDLEELADSLERRLAPPILPPARGGAALTRYPVCLAPRAVVTLLRPLRAALSGRDGWLAAGSLRDRLGERVFDERLSVSDDPLAPARPGSRPLDDDGVVSRRLTLIERGRPLALLADLETGARAGVPSTGHSWRTPGSAPRVGFTNLRVAPGIESRATLLTMMGRGLLVEELAWGGGPNPRSGTLALRAPWTYLVEGGMVRGRLEGITLSGNVFSTLEHLGAVGSDLSWVGAACVPSLLVEGLTVSQTA